MFPLAHFLRQELRDAPGRASYTLRLTLSCAVLITLFMTLQIPFLAVALIVVFYVSQPNVLMIKLVSVVFFCHRQRGARRRAADHQVDL